MSVGFVYDPIFLEHETGEHPENPRRMLAAIALLEESGLLARLARISARDATAEEIALVHDAAYVAAVHQAARDGGGWVDPDTLITPSSYDVAARAVGGTLAAVDAVMSGGVRSAFCLVRPPGHHATPVQAMGFCIFNHVAVAARYLRTHHALERVTIVDFDVHHGNGTQDVFYADPSVLYVSTHEYPFYPGTGAAREIGTGEGRGTNINIPLPHGCGDAEYCRAFEEIVVPALHRFRPELILVSAGYDAHFADPMANQQLSVEGYGSLASMTKAAAERLCGGRIVAALEGGYDLVAMPWSVRRTIEILNGDLPTPDPLGTVDTPGPSGFEDMLREVKQLHRL
ncbi:MAG: histone deacetylase [Chloroflexota bacterium]|nr:histone deacetylase [Chloroflexota bacterium]